VDGAANSLNTGISSTRDVKNKVRLIFLLLPEQANIQEDIKYNPLDHDIRKNG
jgi:hypothetical protein